MNPFGEDRIHLENLHTPMFLGAFAHERRLAQNVVLNLEISVDVATARQTDALIGTLDYANIHSQIIAITTRKSYALLEHLGHTILTELLTDVRVNWARLELRKPGILAGCTPALTLYARRKAQIAIGLGGNLGDVPQTFRRALEELSSLGTVSAVSGLYHSQPWGLKNQPDFLNAAVLVETLFFPRAILQLLKRLETSLGRVLAPRWGPRVIDLDYLVDSFLPSDDPDLVVPHPRMFERAFVLAPLAEIAVGYAPALDALSRKEQASVVMVAEWPTWGANPEIS